MVVLHQSICPDPLVTVMTGFDVLAVINFSLILPEFDFVSCDFIIFYPNHFLCKYF